MWAQVIQNMNEQTESFILVILCFTIFFHLKYSTTIAYKAPAFLTTLGILGTFVGIAFGLLNFNANDVQKSVPALIDGIKTAVWASAFGITCALTIKIRDISIGVRKRITAEGATGATIDDLAAILTAVQQSLAGNDDSTLLSQMKLARQDSNDRLDKLSRSMEDFCNKVAESNSKALIEALKEVIRDFNAKINEQFGENFKHLNQAVEKILVWQEQYRHQIGEMIEQQNGASKNMAVASERYSSLVERAEVFNTVANNMSVLLAGLDTQRKQVDESLRSLATLINTASTGLPEIEKKILEMTKQISNGVKTSNDEFKTVIKSTNEEFKALLLNTVQKSNDEFNKNIKQIIEKTKEQVVVLDKALSEELTKSLESLGRQLAALSQKFAQDYTPITERLQSVLKIAS